VIAIPKEEQKVKTFVNLIKDCKVHYIPAKELKKIR